MALRQQGLASFLKGSTRKHPSSDNDGLIWKRRKSDDSSRFGTCPLCHATFALHLLPFHAETCTGEEEERSVKCSDKSFDSPANCGGTDSRFQACPLCNIRFPLHLLNAHAESCNCGQSASDCEEESVSNKEPKHKQTESASRQKAGTTSTRITTTKEADEKKVSTPPTTTPWWKLAKQSVTPQYHIEDPIVPSLEPIPGLFLFEDFITKQEEAIILAELDGNSPNNRHEFIPWKHANFNGSHIGKRWGVHCNLRGRRVSAPEHPMPHFYHSILLPKLKRITAMMSCIPNEANAIDYRRKQGHWLKSHVDDRQLSKEPIANLSIAGDCFMTFQNQKGSVDTKRVLLKRRTLQVLTGKARYDYSHGIANQDLLSDRRVSITMRESPLTKGSNK